MNDENTGYLYEKVHIATNRGICKETELNIGYGSIRYNIDNNWFFESEIFCLYEIINKDNENE